MSSWGRVLLPLPLPPTCCVKLNDLGGSLAPAAFSNDGDGGRGLGRPAGDVADRLPLSLPSEVDPGVVRGVSWVLLPRNVSWSSAPPDGGVERPPCDPPPSSSTRAAGSGSTSLPTSEAHASGRNDCSDGDRV